MDESTSLKEVEFISGLGVEIRSGVSVGSDVAVADLLAEHDAVVVGAGLGSVPPLGLPGEDLEGSEDALDFIANVRSQRPDLSGQRVAVIGGGNTAIDASTQAAMSGAERVYLVYRRARGEMRAYPHDIERALTNGVEFIHWTIPVSIDGDTRVSGLTCMRTEYVDEDGAPTLVPVDGSEFRLGVDRVLRATGQQKRVGFLDTLPDVELDTAGRVIVDDGFRTTNQRIWAGGDCVNGGKEVVNAVAHGKAAALDIDRTLRTAAQKETRHG
jgi:glutamate synthase (NADPH/NADH) small chain